MLKEADFERPDEDEGEEETAQSEEPPSATKTSGTPSVTTEEILQSMRDQNKPPSQSAIKKDLENLRTQFMTAAEDSDEAGTILPQEKYNELLSKMVESYSSGQLHRYSWNLFHSSKPWKKAKPAESTPEQAAITVSVWRPGQTEWDIRLPRKERVKDKAMKKAELSTLR